VHFSDILTSLSGRPSICSVTSCGLTSHGYPLAGLLSCAWRLTVRSLVDGPRVPTSGYVKLLLPPRQSRGNSLVGLAKKLDNNRLGGHALLPSQEPLPPYELDPMFDNPVIRNRIGELIAKAAEKRFGGWSLRCR
jgi:hypothetical protein